MKKLIRIYSEQDIERAKSRIVPEERMIVVEMKDRNILCTTTESGEESIIPRIPKDDTPLDYIGAFKQFLFFYNKVKRYINNQEGMKVLPNEGLSHVKGSVSRYLRFTVDDENTGSVIYFMFELRVSDHILPEHLKEDSLDLLVSEISKYESEYGDSLEPVQFDFVVGFVRNKQTGIEYATHTSYTQAFKDVKVKILEIVELYKNE